MRSIEWPFKTERWTVAFFMRFLLPLCLQNGFKTFKRQCKDSSINLEEYARITADYYCKNGENTAL